MGLMKCFLCGSEMEPGGIVAGSISVMWFPLSEFQKKGLKSLVYVNGKSIGSSNIIASETKIPNAHYCSKCNKIIGIFDIK